MDGASRFIGAEWIEAEHDDDALRLAAGATNTSREC